MPLVPHVFHEEYHLYQAAGGPVLCLSHMLDLCGLTDFERIPFSVLQRAAERGSGFDRMVTPYLLGETLPEATDDVLACFDGFLAFLDEHDVALAGRPQQSMVWKHRKTLMGCTPDLPLWIDGELWNTDTKCIYPLSGRARENKYLAWRLQLQGQLEAWNNHDEFWADKPETAVMKKAILHCHSKLKNGFQFIPFEQDDARLFDAAVTMATAKLACGFEVQKR